MPTEEDAQNDLVNSFYVIYSTFLKEKSWAGGITGRNALDKLLPRIPQLLAPKGIFYLVALHANNIPQLLSHSPLLNGITIQ